MSNDTPQIQAPPAARQNITARSCIGIILRLAAAIVLGILLALAIYYGAPALYQQIVLPYETRLARLEDAQRLQLDENQLLSRRLDNLHNRISALELQNDLRKQTLDELQTLLAELESAQNASDQAFEAMRSVSNERIAEVARSVEEVNRSLEELDGKLADLEAALFENRGEIQELARRLSAEDAPVAALRRELRLVMAMELLTRSRLFLAQDNLGLARNDIQAARNLLADLQKRVPAHQVNALGAILNSLDSALENLPTRPILAAENLEVAWRLLQQGLPGERMLPTASPAEQITPTPARSP